MEEKKDLEPMNKINKKWNEIIAILATLLIIAVLITTSVVISKVMNNDNHKTNENQNKDNDKKDDESNQPPETTNKVIYIIKMNDSNYIYQTDKQDWDNAKETKLGEYKCTHEECMGKDVNENSLLVYDGKYYIYDYKTTKSETIDLGSEKYDGIDLISYGNKNYGIAVKKMINNYQKCAFYSLEKKKYITDLIYNEITGDAALTRGYIFGEMYDEKTYTSTSYILDIDTGKSVFSAEGVFLSASNGNHLYYLSTYGIDSSEYIVYNDKFQKLFNGESIWDYEVTKDGNILIVDKSEKTFSLYNPSGELVSRSKTYQKVGLIVKDYIGVIDTDGYLKLIDYNGKTITKFIKWSDSRYTFHTAISGYYTGESKVYGVYLVVEDNTIEDGIKGRCHEYYYGTKTGQTGVEEVETCSGYAKPVLYLYPKSDTDVTVSFEKPYLLTTTYPKYNKNWDVLAKPNGDLYDKNGKYYYALYWEEKGSSKVDFNEGFYVTSDNAITFLEEKLSKIGLTDREANEFMMYWLPVLEKNKKSLVYFELTDERQSYNELKISPKPDSLLRLAIHIKKVNDYTKIKEQRLPTFNRTGFTAVEWGGVIH